MRPIALKLSYFGPFESADIDFRNFIESPIFLISGDTGAGKSTILDAMSYALFGATTGSRGPKEVRSQFATVEEETQVTFYFEQGSHLYRVVRSPEQTLMGARKVRNQAPEASLAIVDGVDGKELQSLASKPTDVGLEIAGILRLDHEQFKKIILLPQNDFSRFLKDSSEEKKKILKKIFGTEIFEDFQSRLRERYSAAKSATEEATKALQDYYQSDTWTPEEQYEIEAALEADKLETVRRLLQVRKESHELAKKAHQEATAERKRLDALNQEGQKLELEFKSLEDWQADYQKKILDKADEQAEKEGRLKQLHWATSLASDVAKIDQARDDERANQSKLTKVKAASQDKEKARNDLVEKKSKLFEKEKEINRLREELKKLPTQIFKAKQAEDKQAKIAKAQLELNKIQAQLEENQAQKEEQSESLAQLEENVLDPALLEEEKDRLDDMSRFIDGELKPQAANSDSALKKAEQLETKWQDSKNKLPQLQEEFEQAQREVQAKERDRRQMMIAQLQEDLVDGQACPVCGAEDHPLAENGHMVSNKELINLIQSVDQAQAQYEQKRLDLDVLKKEITRQEEAFQIQKKEYQDYQDQLDVSYKQFQASFGGEFPDDFNLAAIQKDLVEQEVSFEAKSQQNQELQAEAGRLKASLQELDQTLNLGQKDLDAKSKTIESLQAEIAELDVMVGSQELEDLQSDYQKQVQGYEEQKEQLESQLNKNQEELSNYQGQIKTLESVLADLGQDLKETGRKLAEKLAAEDALTHEEAVARTWLAADQELDELRRQITQYQTHKEQLEKDIQQLEESLSDHERPDLVSLEESRQAAIKAAEIQASQVTRAETDQALALKELKAIEKILSQQADSQAAFQSLSQLYFAMDGKTVGDKLDLETYVLQSYLEQILSYANAHFINHLSNNRYQFELPEKARDRRSNRGLDINVYDNETGESRSTDTLSGGETFIAALSIALSLSEVVQNSSRGVPIDALFIDEGFGSLDQETLQKAMQVLEEIGENRLVGVISHIEEMKATIRQQLVIKKTGNGRSQVKVSV